MSVEELAADKLLALFDRAQARDFIDVAALADRFGFDRLCQLAKEKDPGFSPTVLHDMLGGFGRFARDDFGLPETDYDHLARIVDDWKRLLAAKVHQAKQTDPGLGL